MQPVWIQIQFLLTHVITTVGQNLACGLKKQQRNCSIESPRQQPLLGRDRLGAETVSQPRREKSSRIFKWKTP